MATDRTARTDSDTEGLGPSIILTLVPTVALAGIAGLLAAAFAAVTARS